MKYGYYEDGALIKPINYFIVGAHILVVCSPTDYISKMITLENVGWELRDCIKVLLKDKTLQVGLLRKPFKGTVANNVLINGCGGINIDSCRITTNGEQPKGSGNGQKNTITHGDRNDLKGGSITPPEGRFPANLLLKCTCEEVIEGKSEGVVINKKNSKSINDTIYKLGHSKGEQEAPRAYKDTGATHIDSKCPCKKLDIQSGVKNGNGKVVRTVKKRTGFKLSGSLDNLQAADAPDHYGDSGGASRFFFSFKSRDELKEYLIALIRCEF